MESNKGTSSKKSKAQVDKYLTIDIILNRIG